jgi:hypothetical protein
LLREHSRQQAGIWRKIARIDGKRPVFWLLSDIAITAGYKGNPLSIAPARRRRNLVVFSANLDAGDSVEVHDPDGRLPQDQSSWL